MTKPGPGGRAAAIAFALAVLASAGCTSSAGRPAAPPAPRTAAAPAPLPTGLGPTLLAIAPARGLRNGERVAVTIRGFRPEEKVFLSECAPGQQPSPSVGCGQQAAAEPFTITDDKGTRSGTTFRVSARVHGHRCGRRCSIAAVSGDELVTAAMSFG